VPSRLKRYQHNGSYHFLTFSCYRRLAYFHSTQAKDIFEYELERCRRWYQFQVFGYVVMPEHIHLLVTEPDGGDLATALQMLKQLVSRKIARPDDRPFWQPRYYDFNVLTHPKWQEKLRYIHRNPVTRGLVADPADWRWSSFRHWQTGVIGRVEIESQWTFRRRELAGIPVKFKKMPSDAAIQDPSHPTLTPKEG
jgi:putative transposase